MAANRPGRSSAQRGLIRPFSIVDDPDEGDDARLRKRIGVLAGYATIFAPLTIPLQATGLPIAWPVAVALSGFSVGNLLVLARTRRFDRYVVALLTIGVVFVPVANVLGGGVTGATMGLVWAFMASAYAILALGPARATPWFFAFVVSFAGMLAIDPLVVSVVPAPPYLVRLASYVPNIALPLTITFLLFRYTDVRRREAEARTDELLTNAIPAPIAARLRRGEQRIAESYPETTVLFAHIVGFTPWAQRTDPDRVVALLDALFSRFDELAARDGVEKIKTIGDAYMAVAGAPEPREDHAAASLRLARDILDAVAVWRSQHDVALEVRIGLASGRVVAGVIGSRRILFDLWGDTVNTAARMESSGLPGRIQVAPSTRERLRDVGVAFDERTVDVKGLGEMRTYVVRDGS